MGKRHHHKTTVSNSYWATHNPATVVSPHPSAKGAARKQSNEAKKARNKQKRHERNVKAAENFKKVVSWTGHEIDKIVSLPGEAIHGATKATENLKWPLVAAAGLGGVYLLTRK